MEVHTSRGQREGPGTAIPGRDSTHDQLAGNQHVERLARGRGVLSDGGGEALAVESWYRAHLHDEAVLPAGEALLRKDAGEHRLADLLEAARKVLGRPVDGHGWHG
ncbi:MAG: hypothetical protein JWR00_4512 [Rubritepida sp.]|nr:hypothetical protein [Rubritepida sp.]